MPKGGRSCEEMACTRVLGENEQRLPGQDVQHYENHPSLLLFSGVSQQMRPPFDFTFESNSIRSSFSYHLESIDLVVC